MVIWATWSARNTLIYEPSQLQFTRIYDSAMKLATDILPVKQFCIQGKASMGKYF